MVATRFGDLSRPCETSPMFSNHSRYCRAAVRKSVDRRAGIIGIEMPLRSIEHVARTDGACHDLPALTERAGDSGADREIPLLRIGSRRAATIPMLAAARCDSFFG